MPFRCFPNWRGQAETSKANCIWPPAMTLVPMPHIQYQVCRHFECQRQRVGLFLLVSNHQTESSFCQLIAQESFDPQKWLVRWSCGAPPIVDNDAISQVPLQNAEPLESKSWDSAHVAMMKSCSTIKAVFFACKMNLADKKETGQFSKRNTSFRWPEQKHWTKKKDTLRTSSSLELQLHAVQHLNRLKARLSNKYRPEMGALQKDWELLLQAALRVWIPRSKMIALPKSKKQRRSLGQCDCGQTLTVIISALGSLQASPRKALVPPQRLPVLHVPQHAIPYKMTANLTHLSLTGSCGLAEKKHPNKSSSETAPSACFVGCEAHPNQKEFFQVHLHQFAEELVAIRRRSVSVPSSVGTAREAFCIQTSKGCYVIWTWRQVVLNMSVVFSFSVDNFSHLKTTVAVEEKGCAACRRPVVDSLAAWNSCTQPIEKTQLWCYRPFLSCCVLRCKCGQQSGTLWSTIWSISMGFVTSVWNCGCKNLGGEVRFGVSVSSNALLLDFADTRRTCYISWFSADGAFPFCSTC